MAAEQPTPISGSELVDAQVRDFLEQHLDFFQRNPDMLRKLHIPHASGDAVSLVERQVSVLRERNVDLRHRLRDLTDAARDNEQLYMNTRKLVLELLEVDSLQALFDAFAHAMRKDFRTDQAAIIVFDNEAVFDAQAEAPVEAPVKARASCRLAPREKVLAHLGPLLKGGKPACGALRDEEFNYLFPDARGSGSAAVVAIRHGDSELGLLAVGSADAKRYHPQMGTIFLEHIAAVMARLMPRVTAAR
ncbi:MAG: DUF484 family protein [Chromatocurvus sp.]